MKPQTEHGLSFDQMLNNLKRRSDWQQLPDIRLAMWPGQVSFSDDLSNRSLFNDRYIESRIFVGKLAFVLYLVSGAFIFTTSAFVWLMFDWISGGGSVAEGLVLHWDMGAFGLFSLVLGYALSRITPACVRFNRQAQAVHIYNGKNKATTVSWQDVHAFTEFSASADGKFTLRLVFKTEPSGLAMTSGAFDVADESALVSNLTRLEFLRRYMAGGLSSIQPDPHCVSTQPSGFTPRVMLKDDGLIDFLIAKFVVLPAYLLAGGPLIDRYLLRHAADAQWPSEVERLCAPGADLSGYDTAPVQAHEHVYHRFNGRGFDLVNLQGEVIG